MGGKYMTWILIIFILSPLITNAWRNSRETQRMRREPQEPREMRRGVHYHNKRHMPVTEPDHPKRTTVTSKQNKRVARKPSGHLTPLADDDMDNDEVVSVAIGPPIRPKFEKNIKKQTTPKTEAPAPSINAVSLVKDVLTEITKEFLTRNVNENFVFGQYVGNAMKNLTNELRVNMQHDILDLIVKYQKVNNGDKEVKKEKTEIVKDKNKRNGTHDGDETWPDFTNFAGIA